MLDLWIWGHPYLLREFEAIQGGLCIKTLSLKQQQEKSTMKVKSLCLQWHQFLLYSVKEVFSSSSLGRKVGWLMCPNGGFRGGTVGRQGVRESSSGFEKWAEWCSRVIVKSSGCIIQHQGPLGLTWDIWDIHPGLEQLPTRRGLECGHGSYQLLFQWKLKLTKRLTESMTSGSGSGLWDPSG